MIDTFDWGPVWGPLSVFAAAILSFLGGRGLSRSSAKKADADGRKADAEGFKSAVEAAVSLVSVTREEFDAMRVRSIADMAALERRSDERLQALARKVAVLEQANAWYRSYNQKLIVQLHTAGLVPEWPDSPEPVESIIDDR